MTPWMSTTAAIGSPTRISRGAGSRKMVSESLTRQKKNSEVKTKPQHVIRVTPIIRSSPIWMLYSPQVVWHHQQDMDFISWLLGHGTTCLMYWRMMPPPCCLAMHGQVFLEHEVVGITIKDTSRKIVCRGE